MGDRIIGVLGNEWQLGLTDNHGYVDSESVFLRNKRLIGEARAASGIDEYRSVLTKVTYHLARSNPDIFIALADLVRSGYRFRSLDPFSAVLDQVNMPYAKFERDVESFRDGRVHQVYHYVLWQMVEEVTGIFDNSSELDVFRRRR